MLLIFLLEQVKSRDIFVLGKVSSTKQSDDTSSLRSSDGSGSLSRRAKHKKPNESPNISEVIKNIKLINQLTIYKHQMLNFLLNYFIQKYVFKN